ncbi:MAG: WD40/YVTN/BNR-like repeat-containing protein, partial [Bacteroidota bacterium]
MKAVLAGLLLAILTVGVAEADIQWRNLGPSGGGWIQSLACDPRDPDTIYLGCDVGGFYRSDDAGKTWSIHNDGLTDYFIQSIAVHPRDTRIIVLGAEGGIFKTTDGCLTWQAKREGFPKPNSSSFGAPIGALCFDPTSPDVLYAGIGRPRWGKDGRGEIYKSEDCGESWRLVTAPG